MVNTTYLVLLAERRYEAFSWVVEHIRKPDVLQLKTSRGKNIKDATLEYGHVFHAERNVTKYHKNPDGTTKQYPISKKYYTHDLGLFLKYKKSVQIKWDHQEEYWIPAQHIVLSDSFIE